MVENDFTRYFNRNSRPLLLDGATGTILMARGLKPQECSVLWNISRPEEVQSVHKAYYDAGSDAVLTHSFRADPITLTRFNLEEIRYDINKASAENARKVCPEGKFVLGNIGPTAEFLQPVGPLSKSEAFDSYGLQVRGLKDGGVSGFSLETFSDLSQMECAIDAIKEFSDLPYLCSMTFQKGPRGYFTQMGVSVKDAVLSLDDLGAFAVGTNCGKGIKESIEIVHEMRRASNDIRIVCEPNAGIPMIRKGVAVYYESCEFFEGMLDLLMEVNPSIIGGCCGTTPAHIRVMKEFLENKIN